MTSGRPRTIPLDTRSSNPDIILIDAQEAAWLLRWDVTTVRRKIRDGAIPATANPRNPQDADEANGLKNTHRTSRLRYRIKKEFIAQLMYGTYVDEELQPMTPEQLAEALTKLNAALAVYEEEKERQKAQK